MNTIEKIRDAAKKPERYIPKPKKRKVFKTPRNLAAFHRALKQLRMRSYPFRPARAFSRRSGPYLDTVVQLPVGKDQWLNLTTRTDTRTVAKALRKNPRLAGVAPAANVQATVKRLARLHSANRALKNAIQVLRSETVSDVVPRSGRVIRQLQLSRKLLVAQIAAERGNLKARNLVSRAVSGRSYGYILPR